MANLIFVFLYDKYKTQTHLMSYSYTTYNRDGWALYQKASIHPKLIVAKIDDDCQKTSAQLHVSVFGKTDQFVLSQ